MTSRTYYVLLAASLACFIFLFLSLREANGGLTKLKEAIKEKI